MVPVKQHRRVWSALASLGREGALRVTVGTQPENDRFVRAFGELVAA